MSVYVCGNSHVAALAASAGPDVTVFPFGNGRHERERFSRLGDGVVHLTPQQYADNVARFTGHDALTRDHTWGLLMVNHNARIYRSPMWLRHAPWQVARPRQRPVSDDLLRTMIERDQAGVRLLFEDLQAAGIDCFAISAPHPRRDGAAVGKGIRPAVIAHIDRVARTVWQEWLDERGIALVTPPPETVNQAGMLRDRFAQATLGDGRADPHHANEEYGALMVQRIREHLAAR